MAEILKAIMFALTLAHLLGGVLCLASVLLDGWRDKGRKGNSRLEETGAWGVWYRAESRTMPNTSTP